MARARRKKHVAVRKAHKKKVTVMTRKQWEEFLSDLADKVLEAVDYWCWNVSPDTPAECYSAHAMDTLYDLANEFIGYSYGISEEDVKKLEEAPDDIYEKYNDRVQKAIERVANSLCKEYGCYET